MAVDERLTINQDNLSYVAPAQYGITAPISTNAPTVRENEQTAELEKYLRSQDVYETDEELSMRMEVLRKINLLVRNWIRDLSIERNIPPDVAESVGGKVFTFGSYRLGVHTKGADIDTLCVAPRHIRREDFFTSFYELMRQQSEVTECLRIEDAFVPVIKMKFDKIELDMLFARLALKEVPDSQTLDDDNLLLNLEEKCVRSLNGCRVTDEILRLVPNKENFRLALRAIKLWAKRKRIYSNAFGYLGGVSWAMLVARTCQLYPNASPSVLVNKFFLVFTRWSWPKPVLLKNEQSYPPNFDCITELVWDPRVKVGDRFHLMPIITPAFPQQNSTFNVTISTRKIIEVEMNHALKVTMDILVGKEPWDKLFEPTDFFHKYKHYVALLGFANTHEDMLVFTGLVESRLRVLVAQFERSPGMELIHLLPERFEPLNRDPNLGEEVFWLFGIELKKTSAIKTIDLTNEIQGFVDVVAKLGIHSRTFRPGMRLQGKYLKRKDLKAVLPQSVLRQGRPPAAAKGTRRTKIPPTNSQPDLASNAETGSESCQEAKEDVPSKEKDKTGKECKLVNSVSVPNLDLENDGQCSPDGDAVERKSPPLILGKRAASPLVAAPSPAKSVHQGGKEEDYDAQEEARCCVQFSDEPIDIVREVECEDRLMAPHGDLSNATLAANVN